MPFDHCVAWKGNTDTLTDMHRPPSIPAFVKNNTYKYLISTTYQPNLFSSKLLSSNRPHLLLCSPLLCSNRTRLGEAGACEALARALIKANKLPELACWVNRAIGIVASFHPYPLPPLHPLLLSVYTL